MELKVHHGVFPAVKDVLLVCVILFSCDWFVIELCALEWSILLETKLHNIYWGLSFSFKALAALNPAAVEALICIFSPVLGFRPSRAFRARGSKVPNPEKLTFLPSARFCVGA